MHFEREAKIMILFPLSIVVFGVAAALISINVKQFFAVDNCLDLGGKYLNGLCVTKMNDDMSQEVGDYLLKSVISNSLFSTGPKGHPNVVRVGDGLKNKLLELKPIISQGCKSELKNDFVDQKASHIIFFICDNEPLIGLRLRFDEKYHAFHILGYWTAGL